MTAHWTVRRHWRKLKQNANEGCNSCASLAGLVVRFIACFILLVNRDRSLMLVVKRSPAC